jgi:hypothetical protein
MKYIIALLLLSSCTLRTDPGNGKKIGRIVRLSQQGLFFKTWEGELIRGGLNDGSGSIGQSFYFTIEQNHLLPTALKAFEEQKEVVMDYHCEFISSITRSENCNPYFVDSIKFVEAR